MTKLQSKKLSIYNKCSGQELEEKLVNINNKISTAIKEVQQKKLEDEMTKFRRIKASKGNSAAVFKLRDEVLGSSKQGLDPVVLLDPNTNLPVMTPEEIKTITLNYCVNLLSVRQPSEEYASQYERKVTLHNLRMNEIIDNDVDILTPEVFSEVLGKL